MINSIINYFHLTAEQFEKLTAQQTDILLYILTHGSITPMDAFSVLHITKLATRISEMKTLGIQFNQVYESRKNGEGKSIRYMRYRKAAA